MKYIILISVVLSCLPVTSQGIEELFYTRKTDTVELINIYNASGYFMTGMLLLEELSLFSDSTFFYINCRDFITRFSSFGKYSQVNDHFHFEHQMIQIDTFDREKKIPDINKTLIFTELKLVKNRNYLNYTFPDLIEWTKPMSRFRTWLVHGRMYKYNHKFFLPRRRYFDLVKSNNRENLIKKASR